MRVFWRYAGSAGRVILLAVLIVLAAVPAYAQPAGGGSCAPPLDIPVYEQLYWRVKCWLENVGAFDVFMRLGQTLLVVLVLIQFYSGWVSGSPSAMAAALVRLILGSFLLYLLSTGFIDELLGKAYAGFAGIGGAVLSRTPGQLASFSTMRENISQFIGMVAGAELGIWAALVFGISVVGVVLFWFVLWAVFVALYFMVQTFALLILGLAQLIAPLSFAAIGFQGTARWTWRWVSGVLNALVTVLLANLGASAAMWLSGIVPTQFVQSLFPQQGAEAGAFLAGVILPILGLFIIPAFGILALMKVETVVAHFTDAFGDFTATMVDLATGAIGWRMFRSLAFAGGGVSGGPVTQAPVGYSPTHMYWEQPGGARMPQVLAPTTPMKPPTAPEVAVTPAAPAVAITPPITAAPAASPVSGIPFDHLPWQASGAAPPSEMSTPAFASGFESAGWEWKGSDRGGIILQRGGQEITLTQGKNEVALTWQDAGRSELHRVVYRSNDIYEYKPAGSKDPWVGRWR